MYEIVLIRHGESEWNLANRFTGWADVDLTDKGVLEAKNAAQDGVGAPAAAELVESRQPVDWLEGRDQVVACRGAWNRLRNRVSLADRSRASRERDALEQRHHGLQLS